MENEKNEKNEKLFFCENCDFRCRWKCDWNRHLTTAKHIKETKGNEKNDTLELQPILKNKCPTCNKCYKTRSGLWKHMQMCEKLELTIAALKSTKCKEDPSMINKLAMCVIKQNDNLSNIMLEQSNNINAIIKSNESVVEIAKQATSNNVVNSNNRITNNITNNFNLNVFLNEKCKDAINITDFIETVQIQMNELENVGTNGYVNGITDIILARLKDLDVSKRPVHCTDLKREVLYIRDENEWNRDEDKSKIKNMITRVANKNYRKIPEWREEHPDCKDPENQQYDFCINMMRNSLGDLGDEQVRLDNKIIKNIAKEVLVQKT